VIWCAEVYGWTPAQVRELSLRELQLLSEWVKFGRPKPKRR
jgi:hypothetical protein